MTETVDHLETARVLLRQSDHLDDDQDPREWILAAQAHALIDIAESLRNHLPGRIA